MEKSYYFGFLRYREEIEFNGGIISLVDDYDGALNWIDEYTHEDGFLYPALSQRYIIDPKTMKLISAVPRTQKPAHLHKLPASHKLHLLSYDNKKDIMEGVGAFIIHLLAYLFGTRLQFRDWWFDGRIPIQSQHNIYFTKTTLINFISHCFDKWQKWNNDEVKKKIINLLYMHSRAPSYEWDWESFMIEYMVFDSCYNLAQKLYNIKAKIPHKERFNVITDKFGLAQNDSLIEEFWSLRNDLFHEALWDKGHPCTAKSNSAFTAQYNLRRFNQRFIAASLNYKTTYVQSGWWYLGKEIFEPV